jgi:hypothetical protein
MADDNRETEPLISRPSNNERNAINTNFVSPLQNEIVPQDNGVHLRAKLRFFFMSPCWKWHLKRQCPWKAFFQFLKIIIVTTQVSTFFIHLK